MASILDLNHPDLIEAWTMGNVNAGLTALYGERDAYDASLAGAASVEGVLGGALQVQNGRANFSTPILPATGDWAVCGHIIVPSIPSDERTLIGQYSPGSPGRLLVRISPAGKASGTVDLFVGGAAAGSRVFTAGQRHFFMAYRQGGAIGMAIDAHGSETAGLSQGTALDQVATSFFDEPDLSPRELSCIAERWRLFGRVPTPEEYEQLRTELNPYVISGTITVDGAAYTGTVWVLKESTGALIAELVTDANGQYSLLMATQDPVILLAKPPAGYQPLAHGPINPSLRNQS